MMCWHEVTTVDVKQTNNRVVEKATKCAKCGLVRIEKPCRCCGALTANPDAWAAGLGLRVVDGG